MGPSISGVWDLFKLNTVDKDTWGGVDSVPSSILLLLMNSLNISSVSENLSAFLLGVSEESVSSFTNGIDNVILAHFVTGISLELILMVEAPFIECSVDGSVMVQVPNVWAQLRHSEGVDVDWQDESVEVNLNVVSDWSTLILSRQEALKRRVEVLTVTTQ